ncbi:MAG: dehydrogenase [Rhodocyclaceae bacterium]|nr:MAG: dehydrogenase [Rhodocyclaceae bacterium]TND05598.1 MAG: dehydrogenase [Rhodocyclaceae bacterium]
MRSAVATVCVSGAGQLGSRYLQGLAKCRMPLRIHVHDVVAEALERARQRWSEVHGAESDHEVLFHEAVETLPREFDIVIVATTADVRPALLGKIARHAAVRFWVLEKVLAQSLSGLDEIVAGVGSGANAWVNTPRRMMPWHQAIKAQLGLARPMTLRMEGGAWGLACNAVHVLDLLAWWTGETLQSLITDRLIPPWYESKRRGVWEIAGVLEARFSGGSCAVLDAGKGTEPTRLEVTDSRLTWLIKEADGLASRSDGLAIPGRMEYQSEMTAPLVESLLEKGTCHLPTLEESLALHRVFIGGMLQHWRQAVDFKAIAVPIT